MSVFVAMPVTVAMTVIIVMIAIGPMAVIVAVRMQVLTVHTAQNGTESALQHLDNSMLQAAARPSHRQCAVGCEAGWKYHQKSPQSWRGSYTGKQASAYLQYLA
ncbi:hypothetical protein [Actinomadura sp. HBU206391]|uniref:hypothetical protein n=1 Tax=Actinomadura sp. HBU206391 TaxID=2731692 RepID=UPI00164F2B2D|nr:hypothetical protein [Actinomadura sp. HBU206391]MBC6457948.1 hypothetical protein [Actinomadura sp. HBU206391]